MAQTSRKGMPWLLTLILVTALILGWSANATNFNGFVKGKSCNPHKCALYALTSDSMCRWDELAELCLCFLYAVPFTMIEIPVNCA